MPRGKDDKVHAADQLAKMQRQLKAQEDLINKIKRIRALHIAAYNMHRPVTETALEFFYMVGDILEGQEPEKLPLKMINKEEFLKELTDG